MCCPSSSVLHKRSCVVFIAFSTIHHGISLIVLNRRPEDYGPYDFDPLAEGDEFEDVFPDVWKDSDHDEYKDIDEEDSDWESSDDNSGPPPFDMF